MTVTSARREVTVRSYELAAPTVTHACIARRRLEPSGSRLPSCYHDRIGPYAVERLISLGMSLVYRASTQDGRAVVVKTPNPVGTTIVEWEHFGIEQSIRIRHPNIVRVLDAGMDGAGVPYLTLELLEGETLEQRMLRRRLPVRELVRVARQLCWALTAVHREGIVHRDVKPANAFVCWDGTVKLIDFGIARPPSHQRRPTAGSLLGTVAYLSPEQARGDADVDARSDVWSLGALMYEGLTGRPPYAWQRHENVLFARLHHDATPLREVEPKVHPALAAHVDRCLARDRDLRFASACALERALARFAALHLES